MDHLKVISAGGAGGALTDGPNVISAGGAGRKKKKNSRSRSTVKVDGTNSSGTDQAGSPSSKVVDKSEPQQQLEHESHELFEMVSLEESTTPKVREEERRPLDGNNNNNSNNRSNDSVEDLTDALMESASNSEHTLSVTDKRKHDLMWLSICFLGIMVSFVCYGLLLEYVTSGGRKLHEMSFLFITSLFYTLTGAAGRYVRDEKATTIPPARFAVLGMTSMGSTFCSVRSLRYVIYPIQVLAKSCKPVPVMVIGALLGKHYPLKKYLNVLMIVGGVGLFMGGGTSSKKHDDGEEINSNQQIFGGLLLFTSLCFDGGTGAYEDKLMAVHQVQPFDLMFNIQLGKTILSGIGLIVFNEVHIFLEMVQEMGFLLVALSLSGAVGQAFIFITISKFGALTCSIIGLARKVTTLVASIYFYGHVLNNTQSTGLVICVAAMVMNFAGKSPKKGHRGEGYAEKEPKNESDAGSAYSDEKVPMLTEGAEHEGDVELGALT